MGVNPGHKGKFSLGAAVAANITGWEMGGISHDLSDATALQAEWKKYEYGLGDGGEITLNGFLDMSDTTGQVALNTAAINKTKLNVAGTNDPRLYFNATQYFELSTGAEALVKNGLKIGGVDTKTGLATVSFTLQVSGGYMQLHVGA